MKSLTLLFFVVVFIVSVTISCERIPPSSKAFDLNETELVNLESIPLKFGKLVTVTSSQPGIAHFWFEDEQQTIRRVQVNYGKDYVVKYVTVISRK